MRWVGWVVLVSAVVACGGGAGPGDPLGAAAPVTIGEPARAVAVGRGPGGGVAVAMALELSDAVRVYEEVGGVFESWGDAPVGVGPRSVAAVGEDFLTADSAGRTLTRVRWGASGYSAVTSAPLERTPLHVASVDDRLAVVTLGTGAEAAVQLWELPADPAAAPVAVGAVLPIADATLTVSGPSGLIVVRRLAGDLVSLGIGGDGLVAMGMTPVCPEPRAAAELAQGSVAVACAGGVSYLGGERAELPAEGNLYDVLAADLDLDGQDDLAVVDLASHSAKVWMGGSGEPIVHPLSRGPIALRAADLGGDGDLDLIVLAFEDRVLDILENKEVP